MLDPFWQGDKTTVIGDTFAVVSIDTNRPHTEAAKNFGSEPEARDYMSRLAATDPLTAARLHVIPAYEAA